MLVFIFKKCGSILLGYFEQTWPLISWGFTICMIGLLGNWFSYRYAKMAQQLSCKFFTPPFYIRDKNSRTLLQSLWEIKF